MKTKRGRLSAVALTSAMILAATPAMAWRIVYDPWNHQQTLLTAAHTLEQVRHALTSLENQATMLANDALNLASLPYSALEALQRSASETEALLAEAKRLAYDVADIERAFAEQYGEAAADGTIADMVAGARERWVTSVAAFEDALNVQATVVSNLERTSDEMAALMRESQSATGALQAAQAGNQLLALSTQQLSDLTAVLAAQSRATALEQARIVSAEAQADERLRRFLTPGPGYTPTSVSMFWD